jgi:general secretion pathway protein A
MYLSYYQLKDEPFRLTPDPRFLHLSEPHQAALTAVLEGIFYRKGLVMITGPIGTGKTTLVHAALQLLTSKKMPIKSALLFNPTLTRDEFMEMMLEEFEVECTSLSKPKRLMALHQMLLDTQRSGGTSVLFIDEAHLLSSELLEEIRLLGNADTHQEKLLQIVLSGQPELATMMNRRELSALQQRIASRAQLRPLSLAETRVYIAERLHSAGLDGPAPFAVPAVESIYKASQGVPRLINLVCDACLVLGFKTQRRTIQPDIVDDVAISLNLNQPEPVAEEKSTPAEKILAVPAPKNVPSETVPPVVFQKTAVDLLIEAMKHNRATARE